MYVEVIANQSSVIFWNTVYFYFFSYVIFAVAACCTLFLRMFSLRTDNRTDHH